jgi:hypothetical protein
MLDYKVISLFNKTNQFSVDIYQRTKTEFKIRTKIGYTSFSDDYCHGMYELARTCFCYLINGYEMTQNNLGYEFAYAVHSGVFTEYEPPFTDEPFKEEEVEPTPPPLRRTGYENSLSIEDPSILIRTENVILDPEVELPWKLAD